MASNPNSTMVTNRQTSTMRGISKDRPVSRRPSLMRSSATAPCLAISNASRNDLSSIHSASKASALLSRVAAYSLSQQTRDLSGSFDRSRSKSPQTYCHSPHSYDESSKREKRNLKKPGYGQSFYIQEPRDRN